MATPNNFTYLGQELMLYGREMSGSEWRGSIVYFADTLRLFVDDGANSPNQEGDFTEPPLSNGYHRKTIVIANWELRLPSTHSTDEAQVVLTATETSGMSWTATGGPITNIKGALICDSNGDMLAWWQRSSAFTLNPGDSVQVSDLGLRIL